MTLRIFNEDGKSRDIDNVVKVLNHSAGTGNNGIDIEVLTQDPETWVMNNQSIHLDKWDFYSVHI